MLDPVADPFVIERARASIAESFPAFRNVAVADSWGGMIDVMPDAIPVISAVEKVPGFFIATGFSGHGFGIGPGAGRLIAEGTPHALMTGAHGDYVTELMATPRRQAERLNALTDRGAAP